MRTSSPRGIVPNGEETKPHRKWEVMLANEAKRPLTCSLSFKEATTFTETTGSILLLPELPKRVQWS